MSTAPQSFLPSSQQDLTAEGERRIFDGVERVFYSGYWIKTCPVPADTLRAKRDLIDALTRRLFNHTEHGLNVPGCRLKEARAAYDAESDAARRRVKGAMLAGALVNRASDIFRRLVDLQSDGVEIRGDYSLVAECGKCLIEALELGRMVYHRSGEEGIDELWGEPFRVFSISVEEFYEGRYIKTGQAMRDIDRIARSLIDQLGDIPLFAGVETLVQAFAAAARVKVETLRGDADIFDVWASFVSAGERLVEFVPACLSADAERPAGRSAHGVSDGLQLIRNGRALVFHIARARTPMPKSTQEFIESCEFYRHNGRLPAMPAPLPG
ncbi:MAG: hypothetical protein KGI67_06710 [Pseudomonadota bacterium]|nr:hypothetical protein [Pseudomonadota bacterium]